jgi:predicted tellurium resistance membrane protein TerC
MGGMLLIGLLIELCALVVEVWPLVVAAFALWLLWRLVILPSREARARERRDRLRHERARREIDRIATETRRAMYGAAALHGDIIEGTAVEVRDR